MWRLSFSKTLTPWRVNRDGQITPAANFVFAGLSVIVVRPEVGQKAANDRWETMTETITPVILCGGSGTRLWPLSRKAFPKQFSKFFGEESLFQASVRRLGGDGFSAPVVLTNEDFRFLAGDQLAEIGVQPEILLVEPEGRNTAPAILAAALQIYGQNPDQIMLVAPSDHVIATEAAFLEAVFAAITAAREGAIVTFGVKPTRPETGYGYLELTDSLTPECTEPQPLARFVEKPDQDTAEQMIGTGRFLWNAGLFMATARTMVEAFHHHAPALGPDVQAALDGAAPDLGFIRLEAKAWGRLPDVSVDYAVMEKATNLKVMPYEGAWSDLGDWASVLRETPKDPDGLAALGPATAIGCAGSLLMSEDPATRVVGIGLTDTVVVATSDAVLVADKARAQEVRQAVRQLAEENAPQATTFPRDHRPWGWFDVLAGADRFQVKRIHVNPGASLSLQTHEHRSEHWIVVEGQADVTLDDQVTQISANQSIYIPQGARHRLSNPGQTPLVLIEVQTGAYLGEDDIVRYEDDYARK